MTSFLPSLMVARNAWGSNSRLALAAVGTVGLRPGWGTGSNGLGRVTFFPPGEPLGWRAGDISTSLLPKQRRLYFTALLGQREHPRTPVPCTELFQIRKTWNRSEILSMAHRSLPIWALLHPQNRDTSFKLQLSPFTAKQDRLLHDNWLTIRKDSVSSIAQTPES